MHGFRSFQSSLSWQKLAKFSHFLSYSGITQRNTLTLFESVGAQQVVREFLEQYERLSDKRTFIDVTGEARKSIKVQLRFL